MDWATKQTLIGTGQIIGLVVALGLLLISPPLAFVVMLAVALPTLGFSIVAGVLAVCALFIALMAR
jgi:hypothetical protein